MMPAVACAASTLLPLQACRQALRPYRRRALRSGILLCAALMPGFMAMCSSRVLGAPLAIADEPLTSAVNQIKPNIALVIDDSGSMQHAFVPDAPVPLPATQRCFGAYAVNALFFNPATVYTPPYKIDGALYERDQVPRFPDALLTGALYDGYFPPGNLSFYVNVSNEFYDLSRLALLPREQADRLPAKAVCNAGAGCAEEQKIRYYFSRNKVNPASAICEADEHYDIVTDPEKLGVPDPVTGAYGALEIAKGKINYANWFSYYRNRGYIMKMAVSEAYRDLDPDSFRVGLFFINSQTSGANKEVASSNTDLPIADFNDVNRRNWYERLYSSRQTGWTPLRGALSRLGRMFAGQVADSSDDGAPAAGMVDGKPVSTSGKPLLHWDPLQYSCQKNRVILATDGSWNKNAENAAYGPFGIDGARIGDLDSGAAIPMPYRDSHGDKETLADVAWYFHNTDLRTTQCTNTIGATTYANLCARQTVNGKETGVRMTTSTIGLGVSGQIPYSEEKAGDPAYLASIDWPPVVSNEVYVEDDTGKIDDVWHAAVNGGGNYYNVSNAQVLQASLKKEIDKPERVTGSGAGLAVSSSVPSSSDLAYAVSYQSGQWSGDLRAYRFDEASAYSALAPKAAWSAQALLTAARNAAPGWAGSRKVKYFSTAVPGNLQDFEASKMAPEQALLFKDFCNARPTPGQCGNGLDNLDAAQQAKANDPANLIAWLRGDQRDEIRPRAAADLGTRPNGLYRTRSHVLGDIVNATPVFAGGPPFSYSYDPTYGEFKSLKAGRRTMLYAGANDGMLHAFDASSGNEQWAYVPQGVMANLKLLADRDYDARHQYFVDGRVVLGDVCSTLAVDRRACVSKDGWRSILVGGLNKGGCSYYALDVTDPNQPRGLWEFSNDNLGLSFSEPIIGKLKDGTWVVVVASGYNQRYRNASTHCGADTAQPAAAAPPSDVPGPVPQPAVNKSDGYGHVFVLDAMTGALLRDMKTPLVSEPGGLVRLNAWFEIPDIPEIERLYGGDLDGNLWRFEMGSMFDANRPPVRLASLKDADGKPQAMTTTPLPIRVTGKSGSYPVVLVGTGKYMAVDDAPDRQLQTVYAIKDNPGKQAPLRTASLGTVIDVVANSRKPALVPRSISELGLDAGGNPARTIKGDAIDWDTSDGWYIDLAVNGRQEGDRVNVDMQVVDQTLIFLVNTPSPNLCRASDGRAALYYVDMVTGLPVPKVRDNGSPGKFVSNDNAGVLLPNAGMGTGFAVLRGGDGVDKVQVVRDTGDVTPVVPPAAPSSLSGTIRRSAWKELVQ
ncbi:MAG: pilus assembly protein [Janthinobacterium lividum]